MSLLECCVLQEASATCEDVSGSYMNIYIHFKTICGSHTCITKRVFAPAWVWTSSDAVVKVEDIAQEVQQICDIFPV